MSDEPFVELIMSVSNLLQAFANSSSGDFNESFSFEGWMYSVVGFLTSSSTGGFILSPSS